MKKAFLFLLGLIAFIGVQAQTSPYTGAALADGDFFLYNVETGLWLQNNDGINKGDWNTRGAVGTYGFDFAITAVEGGYQLNPKFGHNQSMNASNFYLDTGDALTVWTIEAKTVDGVANAYTIKSGDKVLSVDADNKLAFGADANTWQLVTRDERIAYLEENASADNPIDATFLINDPGFAHENSRASAWQWSRNGGNLDDVRVDDGTYRCRRSYAVWNTSDFTLKQTISGVPNGKYEMTIKGYYRDGNRDDVAARRTAGTERLLANYFVGETKAPVMSILDGAAETRSDNLFYYPDQADAEAPYGYYPDNAGAFNRIFQDYPDAYTNKGVVGIVSDGTLIIGVEKIEANASDWFAFDDFRIKYLGNEIDLSEFVAALEEAIAAAEAFDGSKTSTALQEALSTALADAQSKRTSQNKDEIIAATTALNQALNSAKAVDVSVLKATAELAKAEGIDTGAADEVVATATDNGPVAAALFDLRAARKVKAQALPDIYTGSAPAEGKVYIYNLGTGMFLGTGASYNTHCAVDQVGIEIELIADGDGFKMKTNRGTGWLNKGNRETSTYVDCPEHTWQFLSVSDGIYNISFDGSSTNLLGYNPYSINDNGEKYWSSIGIMREDAADPNNQWKIVTAEEREALLAKASKENPVDVSYLIKSASMNAQDNREADWTREVNGGNGGAWVNNTENHGYEVWNADDFKIHQTIEGLKPGLYEVSVSGFWREGDGANQANIVNNDGALQQKAYLYANDQQALLKNIASCPDFAPGFATQASVKGNFPNWPAEGLEYFEVGAFKTSLNVIVEDDGTLTLGVGVDEKLAEGDWVVMDNFRLKFLGGASDYDRALVSIEDGKNYSVFTEVDGQKYYVTADGKLTTDESARGAFNFEKVTGGDYVEYGFKMKNGATRFTNPPLANNVANLTPGAFATTTSNDRNSWEAQVFFKQGDLYAIRSCNVHDATTSWNDAGRTYWTYAIEEVTPQYTYDKVYQWQLEENQIVDVALNLVLEEKVIATENASLAVGTAPTIPAAFKTNADVVAAYKGLVYFEKDVDTIEEGTTEVNFTAQSAISESFANAKWFNMNIRGSYWVNMDETEPYYPTVDKDLESEASLWAFGAVEGEPNQIVIWNRAAGPNMSLLSTGELDAAKKPLVAMREGQTAWDFAPNSDGFVIHQVGTGENEWVNQNGGTTGPLSIWNSASAKGDAGSVLRIYPVEIEEPEALELAIDVERVIGQGYTPTYAEVDFAEAKEYLGVEEVTEDMLYFVNPDGTWIDYATYAVSPVPDFTYDGWCDAEGAAAQWGETTMINVKFFEAIPDGVFSICDMNGADEVGKTYTVKWALKANDKSVVYSVNVTFIEPEQFDLTFDDLDKVMFMDVDVESELGKAYEGLSAEAPVRNVLRYLGITSIGEATIAAVQPDGTLDSQYGLGTTDGWRDADGSWKGWTAPGEDNENLPNCPYFYVKADFTRASAQLYEIGGYPGHTDEPAKFTATYAFIKTGTNEAVILRVNLIYGEGPESFTYEGTLDQTVTIPGVPDPVATSTGVEETLTITENEDGTVNITYAGFTMAAPAVPLSDFTLENVVVNENEDGSKSYSFEGEVVVTATTGMTLTYSATLTGTQAEGEGPTLTLVLAQKSGMANEIVFNPNSTEPTPEPAEFAGMIKQILSHPDTGVQGQATGEQTVTITPAEDGKVNITYSGFTMPVTGAVIPEFTIEGVTVTENEDGSISYLLEENEDGEQPSVVIDRGTGTVAYKVALEGTQENAEAIPVLKLVLDNSVVDTVWFGPDEKTIDKAIVTAINGVNALGTDGTIFDLSGRKVEKIQRAGIYIVNGKKVSVK